MPTSAPTPEALTRQAFSQLAQRLWAPAEASARRALAQQPLDPSALNALAIALNGQQRFREAADGFAQLTRLEPAQRGHWMNLGTALRADGRLDDALKAYARAAQLGESSADFLYNVGLLHIDRSDYESALDVLARAAAAAPRDAEIRFQYAQCCHECMRTDEAVAALDNWEQLTGLSTELLARMGLLMVNLGEAARAAPIIARAAAEPHPSPEALMKLAQIWERTNQVEPAKVALSRLGGNDVRARLGNDLVVTEGLIAQREGRSQQAIELFREALAQCRERHLRHFHLFPLAKAFDALGDHAQTYQTLVEAHASQVEHLAATGRLAAAQRVPTMHITQFGCDAADVARWDTAGSPPEEQSPVFIVAFPRSGTTLLEQTLDAHPQLVSMDEQPYLQNALEVLLAAGVRYPESLLDVPQGLLDEARARYWELTGRKVQLQPGQRLVDKNPLNMLRLAAIRRLFPHARILMAVRHPCDVILSCFMQHFRAPEFVLMCRDLATLALGYRRAFDFWYAQSALLAPQVLEVRYETFVANFANQVRAVADFLRLPWNDAMLAPGANARARGFISTPSYAQVLQPVHSRSVGRWKAYEQHFAPVLEQVRPHLERWGYGTEAQNSR